MSTNVATQAAATQAAPPPPAAPTAPAAEAPRLSINQILANLQSEGAEGEAQAEAAEQAEAGAAEGSEENAEAEASEEDKAKAAADGDPFSEEALSTPEGVAKARQILSRRQAKVARREMAAQRRHEGLEKRAAQFKQEFEQFQVINRNVMNDLETMRRGDSRAALTAIGRLSGRDAVEFLTDLNLLIANNGPKQAQESPELAEVKRELAELKRSREEETQRSRASQDERWIQNKVRELVTQAQGATEQYPHLAQFATEDPQTVAQAIHHTKVTHYQEHGTVLDDGECFGILEEYVAHLRGGSPAARQPTGAGQVTGAGVQSAKPGSGRGARPPVSKTISPGLATQSSGAQRDPTDEEVIESVARDKDYLATLFPGRYRR